MNKKNFVQHDIYRSNVGALTTLSSAAVTAKLDAAREQGVKILRMKAALGFNSKTIDEGPLLVGFALGLSATEISEALAADPQSMLVQPEMEHAQRRVYPMWLIPSGMTDSEIVQKLEDVPIPWKEIPEGVGYNLFVHNLDTGTLTTGTQIEVVVASVMEWLDD